MEFSGHVFDVSLGTELYTGKKHIFPGRGVGAIVKFGKRRPWKGQRPLVGGPLIELLVTPPFPPKDIALGFWRDAFRSRLTGKGIGSLAGTGLSAVLLLSYALQA